MIRIVFLIRSLERGGAERQMALLARTLDRRCHVTVVTMYPGGGFVEELTSRGIRVVSLEKRGRWDLIACCLRFWRLMKQIQPDVIHSYLVESNLLAIAFKPFLRSTAVVWGIRASNMDLARYGWFARLTFRLQLLTSRFADAAIFNSQAGHDYHVGRGFSNRNSVVIHGAVDADTFCPDAAMRQAVRSRLGLEDSSIAVALVARLDPMKDHATFIQAAARLARQSPRYRFICVGGGPEEKRIELAALASEAGLDGRLVWLGEQQDMPALYNAFDVVCSSSLTEGLSNSVAEAMACGVRCVVTDVGDTPQLVGNTGVTVPPSDAAALADGIARCASIAGDPRARVIESFSVSQMTSMTAQTLFAVCGVRV